MRNSTITSGFERPERLGIGKSGCTRYHTNTGGRARAECPGISAKPARTRCQFRVFQPPATSMNTREVWWASTAPDLTPPQRSVLVMLAIHKTRNGCFPSISRLQETTCFSRPTVVEALASLERLGLIRSIKRAGKVTRYVLIGVPTGKASLLALVNQAVGSNSPELVNPVYPISKKERASARRGNT